MPTNSKRDWLEQHLRRALKHLYDPDVLRKSPLVSLLDIDRRQGVAFALRSALAEAIESHRPGQGVPQDSGTWRIYQILRHRFTEQLTQQEVAADLGLSRRQLQREEKRALEVLADYLWTAYHLDAKRPLLAQLLQGDEPEPVQATQGLTPREEMESLTSSVPSQLVRVEEMIGEALDTTTPLLESLGVSVDCTIPHGTLTVFLKAPVVKQAFVGLIDAAARCVPDGHIRVEVKEIEKAVSVCIYATAGSQSGLLPWKEYAESLDMARELIELCQGSLERTDDVRQSSDSRQAQCEGFTIRVVLPNADQLTVLVIDDNADALQLVQRYLSGTGYRFVGVQEAEEALVLAEELLPHVILLDVMMPGKDGWTLLGQLREHPKIQSIPIIVCTILPQEQLALTLGAAEFVRKPISRSELLSVLNRQIARPPRGFY